MFPRRGQSYHEQTIHHMANPNMYYPHSQQIQQQYMNSQIPVRRGLFEQQKANYPYTNQHLQYNLVNKETLFRDQNGKLDFKKIGGGVQSVMGIVNQVSPLMKFFIK